MGLYSRVFGGSSEPWSYPRLFGRSSERRRLMELTGCSEESARAALKATRSFDAAASTLLQEAEQLAREAALQRTKAAHKRIFRAVAAACSVALLAIVCDQLRSVPALPLPRPQLPLRLLAVLPLLPLSSFALVTVSRNIGAYASLECDPTSQEQRQRATAIVVAAASLAAFAGAMLGEVGVDRGAAEAAPWWGSLGWGANFINEAKKGGAAETWWTWWSDVSGRAQPAARGATFDTVEVVLVLANVLAALAALLPVVLGHGAESCLPLALSFGGLQVRPSAPSFNQGHGSEEHRRVVRGACSTWCVARWYVYAPCVSATTDGVSTCMAHPRVLPQLSSP